MIVTRLDSQRLLSAAPQKFGGTSPGREEEFKLEFLVNDPRGVVCFEAFEAGRATEWSFWHDEFHVCLSGGATVEYTLAPNHREVLQTEIGPNDAVLILAGTRARFHVPEGKPYVHVSLFQPRYEYAKYLRDDDFTHLKQAVAARRDGGS